MCKKAMDGPEPITTPSSPLVPVAFMAVVVGAIVAIVAATGLLACMLKRGGAKHFQHNVLALSFLGRAKKTIYGFQTRVSAAEGHIK